MHSRRSSRDDLQGSQREAEPEHDLRPRLQNIADKQRQCYDEEDVNGCIEDLNISPESGLVDAFARVDRPEWGLALECDKEHRTPASSIRPTSKSQ